MLGKLLKYEWKGLCSPLLIMFAVLAGTTALTCGVIFTINPEYDEAIFGFSLVAVILSVFLYYLGIMGCLLGTMLIIAIRFYKTCYTDQGYLTHTLPVSPCQLLNAKLIAAVLAYFVMFLAVVASLFLIIQVGMHHILSVAPYDYEELKWEISYQMASMGREFKQEFGISLTLYILYMTVYFIITCTTNIIIILGCVSLGQLFAKHRIVGAIVAYFVVQFVEQIFGYVASIPMYAKMLGSYNATAFEYMAPTMNLALLFTIALAAAMYFVNLHMMTKKLNLE